MDLRMDMKKTCVKKRDWTQKMVNHSRLNSQHIWGGGAHIGRLRAPALLTLKS